MENNKDWIMCSTCKGEGKVPSKPNVKTTMPVSKLCKVCRGMRIISKENGTPPSELNFLISK